MITYKKKLLSLFVMAILAVGANANEYFPEGTKWTEIRLDTLKYDNWYSQVGDEWVPNFETIEYYVQGDLPDWDWVYKKVYTSGPEWTDSLTLLIREDEQEAYEDHNCVWVSVITYDYDGYSFVFWPGEAYQFDWSVGKGLYYEDITLSNTTSLVRPRFYYERHYRSMLVHFERNGEVLYDVWPEKGGTDIKSISTAKTSIDNTLYDLKGSKLQQTPQKRVYIQNGKKYIIK